MKKIKYLFLLAAFVVAWASVEAQSGVFSLNGQQTWPTKGNYYASVDEYIDFLYGGVLPAGITKWNGYWKNGQHLSHDRAYFESNASSMQAVAVAQLAVQLAAINKAEGERLFGSNSTVAANRSYLENHIKVMDLDFDLAAGDSIWMLGIYGDFTRGAYVSHGDGGGLYYCLVTNEGHVYILARVSCFNNVDLVETMWYQKGIATIYKEEADDPGPEGGRKVTINGEKVASITKSGGDVNIQLNVTNNNTIRDVTATGGSATATSDIGDVNPGFTGGNTGTGFVTTAPVVAPYTGLQSYIPACNNQGWNGPGRNTTVVFSPTVSWGGNNGSYGRNSPCYGNVPSVRDVPPQTGGFVYNPANWNGGGGTPPPSGGFVYNGARPR